ncbi:MAG: glycosyltransferase family 39 protein [Acidobacteriota bacterium]|nr:glycosyltransferase family 39 protein [Acidobacteriota bacterium]MDQ5835871.1 glycosyltransferase family 39 protein [Acidobacteriota bacterium]
MELDAEKREAGTVAPDFLSRRAGVVCALLLALMGAQMLFVIRQKSITVDEWVMIPAGYYHLTTGDFRPVGEHPPFAKVLAAAPLLLTATRAPRIDSAPHDYPYFLDKFDKFWHMNAERFDYLTFWARVPAILVTLVLGALVFVFARRHWGARAALFAVALFAFEPTVLAHGRVVQTDIPSALAFLLFCFTLYEYLQAPTWRRAVYAGLTLGLAAVTKFSMIALAPPLFLLLAALFVLAPRRHLRRAHVAAHAAALALAAVLLVNAAYFFHSRAPEPLDNALARLVVPVRVAEEFHAPLEAGYYALQIVFPVDFVSGIGWQLGHAHEGHQAGLLGMYSHRGWWYYFPVAFALKTSLPILLLSLAAVAWAALRLRRKVEGRVLLLVVPLAFFTGLLMLSTINIGVRYYLPAYPFFFILAGAMIDDLLRRGIGRGGRKVALAAALASVALCWVVVEAARAYPDHMSYMNQLASARPHWWYLSDSNVEWGDDVRDLALYLRAHGEHRVGAAILCWSVLDVYDIDGVDIFVPPGERPERVRYVAVGASNLNGSTVPGGFDNGVTLTEEERVNYFDEFRRRTPEKVFGGSIYLYRMRE